ncbi:MAG: hypothetical protein AAFY19_06425 [Pseudomonadota bacterium]
MGDTLHTSPITGPFPDGDSRNLTLAQSGNAFEPERTGPQEAIYRREGAAKSVIGDLATSALKPGAEEPSVNDKPDWVQIGKGDWGDTLKSITPGSDTTSVMGGLLHKLGDVVAPDSAEGSDDTDMPETSEASDNARAERYDLSEGPQPSAAESAFGGIGGALQDPLLQPDWNPAERNSDDLSR